MVLSQEMGGRGRTQTHIGKIYSLGPVPGLSQEMEGRGRLYLSIRCHHQNDACVNLRWAGMGSVLIFEGQSHNAVPTDQLLKRTECRSGESWSEADCPLYQATESILTTTSSSNVASNMDQSPQRPYGLLGTGSPARPPRLSRSS